jgi:hypothetical protein
MAYVLLLNRDNATNRIINTDPSDITYTNQRLDSFLPPDIKLFRVEAYLRASNNSTTTGFNVNLQIRVSINPSMFLIDQTMQPVACIATCQSQNIPQQSYQTTQFSQTGYVINRPDGLSNIRVIIWNENTNALLVGGFPYVLHLHFIPIE